MIVFKCDRCNKTYNFDSGDNGDTPNAITTKVAYHDGSFDSIETCHLCPDCMDSFNCWLMNPDFDSDEDEVDENEDVEAGTCIERTESNLKDTFVSMYDVWGMVADMIISCTENINKMDKERKRNG